MVDETRRHLDCRERQGLCGQAASGGLLQDDSFDATASITVCAFTTDETEAPLFRLLVKPDGRNGLRVSSRLMVDKIPTVPKSKLGSRIGRLGDEDIIRLNQAALVFLGLTVSPRSRRGGMSDT